MTTERIDLIGDKALEVLRALVAETRRNGQSEAAQVLNRRYNDYCNANFAYSEAEQRRIIAEIEARY